MKKMQVIIIVLLIVAIVFSVASLAMNLSGGDFEEIGGAEGTLPEGNSEGNLNLVINPPASGEQE